jgi:hypothetical protein
LAGLLVVVLAPGAGAQEIPPERTVSVRDRLRPEYTPPGVAWGAFRLRPDFSVAAARTANLFASEIDPVGELVTTLGANIDAQSQGVRLPLSLYAGVESLSYQDHPLEDYVDWTAGAGTSYSLPRRTNVALTADFGRQHESRSEPSFPLAAIERPAIETAALALEVAHDFATGRLQFSLRRDSFEFEDVLLVDGTLTDQEFRNRDTDAYQIQGNFIVGPSTGIFVRAVREDRDYVRQAGGLDRDATTAGLYVGGAFDLSNLLRGELGIGVLNLDNADPSQQDRRSNALTSSLEIFMTQLMTATISAGRTSAAADIAGFASYIATSFSLRLDYEIRRNLLLSTSLARSQRDYSGAQEEDEIATLRLGAEWLLSRHVKLGLDYAATDQEWRVAAVGRSYDDRVIGLSASFAL